MAGKSPNVVCLVQRRTPQLAANESPNMHGWSLDDRKGDIRVLVAESFRKRGKLLLKLAERVDAFESPGMAVSASI